MGKPQFGQIIRGSFESDSWVFSLHLVTHGILPSLGSLASYSPVVMELHHRSIRQCGLWIVDCGLWASGIFAFLSVLYYEDGALGVGCGVYIFRV